jgi:branched-subunit amino acid transport protein
LAAILTAVAAFLRAPLLVTILVGMVSVVGLRWLGL